jgi:hypothetical protein
MPSDSSPVWIIAKALILFAFVSLFSYTNASNFDSTEITMLVQIGAVLFGAAGIEAFIKKKA